MCAGCHCWLVQQCELRASRPPHKAFFENSIRRAVGCQPSAVSSREGLLLRCVNQIAIALVAIALTACTASRAFTRGENAARAGDWDAAVEYFRTASQENPDKAEYKIALERATYSAAAAHADRGRKAEEEGRLDDAAVERAAESGKREFVIAALALMARAPAETARRIIQSGIAKPAIALVWRAGLSMRVAFKVQTLVMRLKGAELLPARDGVDFPLSEDEMRWHLAYFGLDG